MKHFVTQCCFGPSFFWPASAVATRFFRLFLSGWLAHIYREIGRKRKEKKAGQGGAKHDWLKMQGAAHANYALYSL